MKPVQSVNRLRNTLMSDTLDSSTPSTASASDDTDQSASSFGLTQQQTTTPKKKRKKVKFSSRTPLPFDIPHHEAYAKRIPIMRTFRAALLEHYARHRARSPLQRGLRRFGDLIANGHSHVAAECGVYMGSCLVACAEIIRQYGLNAHIYGLDSFEGLPHLSSIDRQHSSDLVLEEFRKNGTIFNDTSLDQVRADIDERDLNSYITLVPGFFKDTLSTLPEGPYFFMNLDCDLYDGHLECLDFFYPRMEQGGIIFFDDYHSAHYPMAKEAIDKFMHNRPEKLFHIRYGKEGVNHTKTFIVKH